MGVLAKPKSLKNTPKTAKNKGVLIHFAYFFKVRRVKHPPPAIGDYYNRCARSSGLHSANSIKASVGRT